MSSSSGSSASGWSGRRWAWTARRLRDIRLADAARRTSGPARVARARERIGAQGQARDGDHRDLLDPPAEDVHQRAGVFREVPALPDRDPHHVPALGARHCGSGPDRAAGTAAPCAWARCEGLRLKAGVAMTTIRQHDFIQSVADALQFISYYHPVDYIKALGAAYAAEESPAAKDAIAQILTNSRMCAEGHRPICQDTGIVVAFVKIGMDVTWEGVTMALSDMVNEGVRRAYSHPDNVLRASIVADPAGARRNTKDNTPAVVHFDLVPGNTVEVKLAAKGGGSENKAKFAMLNPSDSIVDWVVKTLPTMGAGWCPPGMLGIGIGGSADKAMLMAKEALMEPIDMHALKARGPKNSTEALRIEIFDAANALGIGAQGLGGLSTVLDVKILDYPTHAASLPIGMIPNCAATRHAHFTLDGSGAVKLDPPDLARWPDVHWTPSPSSRRVNLDTLTREAVASWKPSERLLLSGKLLTGRDAAHKRIVDLLAR